ncbi:uncharacterized protein LY89DRAFT_338299 [Mollisia scopiformis]|uniref:C2H2-type domain-containing protein n=1 Tax=Mollisia scopiformis TaxID=149040 RepID=A0A132B7J4_MOLSC|nr:uncharacterized protein LY89DRAFT_338299 [Mollisia scopiformis]KUJ08223.1 hypothetical protein LY89DRAFT_338299 [Mollisia scopiformis]
MKRTLSGSRVQQDVNASKLPYHEIKSPFKIEDLSIPPEAQKHVEYLSRFPLSQVCQWVEIWQRSEAQGNSRRDLEDYCFHNKFNDFSEAKPEIAAMEIERVPIQSERLNVTFPLPTVGEPLGKHARRIYPCSFCDKTFSRKGGWKKHEGSFHQPQKQWSC